MKKMNNKIAKKAMMVMLIAIFAIVGTTSGTVKADGVYNGGKMIKNEKVLKKVQKNAWTPEPDPESKALTLGYAVAEIKEFVEADPQAIVRSLGILSFYKNYTGKELKFQSATKAQRKAIKWGVESSLLDISLTSGDPYGGINGKKQISRAELADLMSRVLDAYYGYRVPFFGEAKYHYTEPVADMRVTALYKGIIVSAPYEENVFGAADKVSINLNAPATRKDLKLALKNLKIVIKYNAVKIAKNPTGEYTYNDAVKDAEMFVERLCEETGYSMSISKVEKDKVVTITDGFNIIMYSNNAWYPKINFTYSSGVTDVIGDNTYSATKYNVIKMMLEACCLRAK